ncbi:MAG TPA: O-antigen ligase family protein [Planctomycetota bacterium]|nr:O-antigen ligase family protein [Planctomycetota bacterium]
MNGAPAPRALPSLLPALLPALLVLPFAPDWLDFEMVRRAQLWLCCGTLLLLFPRLLAGQRGPAQHALLLLLSWNAVSWLAHPGGNGWEATFRLLQLASMFVLLRAGAAVAAARWATAFAAVLVLTSVYGLAQRLGFQAFLHYDDVGSPVSVFGNLNVASEFTAVATAASALLFVRGRTLASAPLLLGGAYLWVNGSRSGLLAMALAALWLVIAGTEPLRRRVLLLLVLGGSAALGLVTKAVGPTAPVPATATDAAAGTADLPRNAATEEVRLQIAASCLRMAADAPLLGCGPGQFKVQYPRYRSQEEIENSSFHRRFRTEARTAHDDYLELLVEGGTPALLLWLLFLLLLVRERWHDRTALAPLLAFLVLMAVRAPLGNAPALAAALLTIGPGRATVGPASMKVLWLSLPFGLLLSGFGLYVARACQTFAPYNHSRAGPPPHAIDALAKAAAQAPFEPRFQVLLAQERHAAAADPLSKLAAAMPLFATALRLMPYDPAVHLQLANLLQKAGRTAEAKTEVQAALQVDPGDAEARVLLSVIYFKERNHEGAVRIVYEEPHPSLRAQLEQHFRSLEELARAQHDQAGELRYACERSLLTVLALRLGDTQTAAKAAELVPLMLQNFQAAGAMRTDLRPWVATGLLALESGDAKSAAEWGRRAGNLGLRLEPWQRVPFGDRLPPLQQLAEWQFLAVP